MLFRSYDYADEKVQAILGDTSPDSPTVSKVTAEALAVEARIALLEVDCRQPLADAAAVLLKPAFDAWYVQNKTAIEAATQ